MSQDGESKTVKTDTIYDVNEAKYLQSLPHVKIKIYKNHAVIDEEFRYEIYKINSRYGISNKYFTEKPFSTIVNIWRVVCILTILLFIALFAVTIALKVNAYLFVGLGLLSGINLIFGIVYAIYFFRDVYGG